MGASVTKEDEKLTIDLYHSELYTLQDKYITARKKATIYAIAEKLEICPDTVVRILKRNRVSRYECPSRVIITRKNVVKER